MEALNLDIARVQVPVTLPGGKKAWIVEASGEAYARYHNTIAKAAQFGDGGQASVQGNLFDAEPLLVSLCVYYADAEGRLPLTPDSDPDPRHRIPEAKVRSMPARVQKALFAKIREISPDLVSKSEQAPGGEGGQTHTEEDPAKN